MAAWITTADIELWSGKFDQIERAGDLSAFLPLACATVELHIGYPILAADYSDVLLSGTGGQVLFVPNGPVNSVSELLLDGVSITVGDASGYARKTTDCCVKSIVGPFGQSGDEIVYRLGFTRGRDNVLISYNGGFVRANVPGSIKSVAAYIAALFLTYPETLGRKSFTKEGATDVFDKWIPEGMLAILEAFRAKSARRVYA